VSKANVRDKERNADMGRFIGFPLSQRQVAKANDPDEKGDKRTSGFLIHQERNVNPFVKRYAPDLVFLSCMTSECAPAAVELVHGLRLDSPGLAIICGGRSGLSESSELLTAGASQICESRSDGHTSRIWRLDISLIRRDKSQHLFKEGRCGSKRMALKNENLRY